MAISTSGLSVPSIGSSGGIDTSSYGGGITVPKLETPKGMTIGDMLDVSKKTLDLQKSNETYADEVARIKAESQSAQSRSQQESLKTVKAHVSNISQATSELLTDQDLTPEKILKRYKAVNDSAPGDPVQKAKALEQTLAGMPQKKPNESAEQYQTRLHLYVVQNNLKGLEHLSAFQQQFPATTNVDVGGQIVNTNTGNPDVAVNAPGTTTGPYLNKNIAPQVYTNPITGQPGVIGGGGVPTSGNLANQPSQVTTSVAGQPPAGGAPTGGQAAPKAPALNAPSTAPQPEIAGDPLGKVEPLKQGANESPANFNARVAKVQGSYSAAQDQLSNPQSENGYIPQLKQVNNSIMTLLKDPDVRTGAVNDYLAGKTNKGALSSKEQELAKYLEQRIQAKTPKSDADAESKRQSYGAFNLDKEALKNLTRQDNAWVLTQELAAQGRMNNAKIGGTTNNPNYARVDAFNNRFAQLSSNPDLMKYISIAGTNPNKIRVDADDDKALRSLLSKMSPKERGELELQRRTLLRMVGGNQ
jgi:hypothetical protein